MTASRVALRHRLFCIEGPFLPSSVIFLLVLCSACGAAGDEILACPGNSSVEINYARSNATAGSVWIEGYTLGGIWDCQLTIGSVDGTTSLWHLFNDGDPGMSILLFYDVGSFFFFFFLPIFFHIYLHKPR